MVYPFSFWMEFLILDHCARENRRMIIVNPFLPLCLSFTDFWGCWTMGSNWFLRNILVKWWIFSQPSSEGSGKNKKSGFFLLGLKSKNLFAEILFWAEQSDTQFFSLSNLLVVSSSSATQFFQFWSSLDIRNYF